MIYLLHGDTFQVHRSLEAIRQRLDTPEGSLAANTIILDGTKIEPLELMQQATVIPFLAPARLVIVDGLLEAIGFPRGRKKKDDIDPLDLWRPVAEELARPDALPEATTLVFLEGDLTIDERGQKRKKPNAAFTLFAPIAQTKDHPAIKPAEIASWVRSELKLMDFSLNEKAVRALVDAVGNDLWAMHNELLKLQAYADGQPIDETTVAEIVGEARDARVWDLTDAIISGDERKAMNALDRLLTAGEAPAMLAAMITRQYRQIVIARDLSEQRASQGEIAGRTGVPAFKVSSVIALANRNSWPLLREAYTLLLDADLAVKRGLQDDESSLQLLVHRLVDIARRSTDDRQPSPTRPATSRR